MQLTRLFALNPIEEEVEENMVTALKKFITDSPHYEHKPPNGIDGDRIVNIREVRATSTPSTQSTRFQGRLIIKVFWTFLGRLSLFRSFCFVS